MENYLKKCRFSISGERVTAFGSANGVHQDGTTPVCRDKEGTLWAISGHSHMGEIAMFAGTCMRDMQRKYAISTNFEVGKAGEAFAGVPYPEGVASRGSIWPFGLYICPVTNRFFAFFHNETGWAGKGTAYDSFGLCEKPALDSDFRHVGLMHSDDQGKTWTFDRWVLSAETVCFTDRYNPGAGNVLGQKSGTVCMGSGDFSLYVEEEGDYIYIFYTMMYVNILTRITEGLDVFVARSRKRSDGVMGDFVKYYNGSFCEAGNFGKETCIVKSAWHPKVIKLKDRGIYLMSSAGVFPNSTHDPANGKFLIKHVVELRTSTDLVNWSEPVCLMKDGKEFGSHYCALYPDNDTDTAETAGNRLILQLGGNGSEVIGYDLEIIEER